MISNSFFEGGQTLKKHQLIKELELKILKIKIHKEFSFLNKKKKILSIIIEYSTKVEKLINLNF